MFAYYLLSIMYMAVEQIMFMAIIFELTLLWWYYNWASACDFQQYGMCDQQSLRSACAYALSLTRAFTSRLSILWLLSYWLNTIWSF